MPNMANITVKKADGTTDITYIKASASAGDGSPAIWKEPTTGQVRAGQPTLSVKTRNNGKDNARRLDGLFLYPKVREDAGGNAVVKGGIVLTFSGLVPQDCTEAEINEATHQGLALYFSSLMLEMMKTGYAAT